MSDRLNHPTPERLHAFVEDTLDGAGRSVVRSHLSGCDACRTEVADLRSLFAALEALPVLEPSVGFADRVMKHVRVRPPLVVASIAWIDRITPQSTRGWAAVAAMLALPVVGTTILVAWLLSQPSVDAQGLWTFLTVLAGDAVASTGQWVAAALVDSALAVWAAQAMELLGSVGGAEIGLTVLAFSTLTAGSIYVLYQNLFRTDSPRRIEHASYVI